MSCDKKAKREHLASHKTYLLDIFLTSSQLYVVDNFKRSQQRSHKVMELQKLAIVQTLDKGIFRHLNKIIYYS